MNRNLVVIASRENKSERRGRLKSTIHAADPNTQCASALDLLFATTATRARSRKKKKVKGDNFPFFV